jgi:heparan-sulfate lyase
LYFKESAAVTPEYLTRFMAMYARAADFMMDNFSASANHLLYEAQSMVYGGTFFREFKNASAWRSRGVELLNREIGVQVMEDGMQYELDFGYHLAAIGTFLTAYNMSKANGYEGEFPASYGQTVEKMIELYCNIMYPDYSEPLFGDNRRGSKSAVLRNMKMWRSVFPDNGLVRYLQTERAEGSAPTYLARQFAASGFYVLRNGWGTASTMMVLKNGGGREFWHNQPDNGTFELWRGGRNFFPDSGCYLYSGDGSISEGRAWFRQTKVHNTLTLDGADITEQNGRPLLFASQGSTDICVTQNAPYPGLAHRRSVFFVDRTFFVVVDEATGAASGSVGLNWNLCENTSKGGVTFDQPSGAHTTFNDNNNIIVKSLSPSALSFAEQEGRVSYDYNAYISRKAYRVCVDKAAGQAARFISVLYPVASWNQPLYDGVAGSFTDGGYSETGLALSVTVGGNTYNLSCTL